MKLFILCFIILAAPSIPPVNVTAENVLSRSLSLSWVSPNQELLNGELTHYLLLIVEQDTNTTTQLLSTEDALELDFLHPFYTYRIRLAAVTVLPGPYSEEVVVTTLEDGEGGLKRGACMLAEIS